MIGQRDRERIRSTHRAMGPEQRCDACSQHWPCDTIRVLDDLETVEKIARNAADLGKSVLRLEEKVRRAMKELQS